MLDLPTLRERYLGKFVVTTRPATPEEARHYDSATWGGAGVVVDILEEDGQIILVMDWGASWPLTDDTTVEIVET